MFTLLSLARQLSKCAECQGYSIFSLFFISKQKHRVHVRCLRLYLEMGESLAAGVSSVVSVAGSIVVGD